MLDKQRTSVYHTSFILQVKVTDGKDNIDACSFGASGMSDIINF